MPALTKVANRLKRGGKALKALRTLLRVVLIIVGFGSAVVAAYLVSVALALVVLSVSAFVAEWLVGEDA